MTRQVRVRYEPNRSEFRQLMLSDQTQDLADQAAGFGVLAARAYAAGAKLPLAYIASIRAEKGPIVVMGPHRNPRRTGRVVAEHALAAVIEFGSGRKRDRPQGGSSPRHRILGRTGSRVGNPPLKGGGPT